MIAAMEDNIGMNQKQLAKKIGVTHQQISKIGSGSQNLTLETIAKLSDALGVELISFPEYKYSSNSWVPNNYVQKQGVVIPMRDNIFSEMNIPYYNIPVQKTK